MGRYCFLRIGFPYTDEMEVHRSDITQLGSGRGGEEIGRGGKDRGEGTSRRGEASGETKRLGDGGSEGVLPWQ